MDGVFGPEKQLGDRHGDGDGRLLQQHDHGRVVDVVHREHAHDARDAVQESHHGELEFGDGSLCRRNGRPDAITWHDMTSHRDTEKEAVHERTLLEAAGAICTYSRGRLAVNTRIAICKHI